ncbi:hypothetical protein Tco_0831942 [Tanacetum coccineum]
MDEAQFSFAECRWQAYVEWVKAFFFCLIQPTRDLGKIMDVICVAQTHISNKGLLCLREDIRHEVEALGKVMKERNLACDAVNFGDQSANKKEIFNTLIVAMDNNGNWHILHIKHPCPIGHALSRSPVIHQVVEGESGIAGVGSFSIGSTWIITPCVFKSLTTSINLLIIFGVVRVYF